MKIVSVVGARPQFIKAAAVSRAIAKYNTQTSGQFLKEILVHTGQHYDANMSAVFFEQLNIPEPTINLGISASAHGAMTGRMIEKIEDVLIHEKPDMVLTYGDTNSTLAGALAAVKLHIPIAHVEAGLRSFNMRMPEEINRIITDRISSLLLCPTNNAVENLKNEGLKKGVHNVGDVMYDIALYYREKALAAYSLENWAVDERNYLLCTVHRAENTDNPERLSEIFTALQIIAEDIDIILPLHPRTKRILEIQGMNDLLKGLLILEPITYLEMVRLEISAKAIITDSGGVQKEAFFYRVPCLTLRDETEWVETVELGWNHICGANKAMILNEWRRLDIQKLEKTEQPYGNGNSAEKIVQLLTESLT